MGPSAPPRRETPPRSCEATVSSHITMPRCLENIAAQEEHSRSEISSRGMGVVMGFTSIANANGTNTGKDKIHSPTASQVVLKERIRNIPPYMKYLIWVALASLGYTIWTEARHL